MYVKSSRHNVIPRSVPKHVATGVAGAAMVGLGALVIAAVGATGRATGPHLHYEVRVDGKAVNPMSFIKAAQNVF